MHAPEKGTRRVVIIGAGFGGLSAAKPLARHRELEITMIDRRKYHLFQPLLYKVAMAGLSPAQIAMPIRALLKGRLNIRAVLDEIGPIDTNRRVVASQELEYQSGRPTRFPEPAPPQNRTCGFPAYGSSERDTSQPGV